MRTFIAVLTLSLFAGFAHATPTAAEIKAQLPSYKPVPQRQLQSKKFQAFISPSNDGKAYTTVQLADRPTGGYYESALVANKVYPGKTFVVLSNGSGPKWLKSASSSK
jgi:hypothetical protein